jgi:hypothetical protein
MFPDSVALLSFCWVLVMLTCHLVRTGLRLARAAMALRLTEEAEKVTSAKLKILEMDGATKRLSEQFESMIPWLFLCFSSCLLVL